MSNPERTIATLSFTPTEFELISAAVDDLTHLPERHEEWMRGAEGAIRSIQGGWLGMNEEAIREDAEQRRVQEVLVSRHNGSVVVTPSGRKIRGRLESEHPVIKAARKVIKFGPPVVKVLEGSEQFWRLAGWEEGAIKRLLKGPPAFEESYDLEVVEMDDNSSGTGLVMKGINVRTGRAALGAYDLPPLTEDGSGFDIGFTINSSLQKQEVNVTIFKQDSQGVSDINDFLLDQLPHLRKID